MAVLTPEEIYQFARQAGFSADQAVTMTAIALAESNGNTEAHNPTGEDSHGLWQINLDVHDFDPATIRDPLQNARAAYAVSNGGSDIGRWTVTHSGYSEGARYLRHMEAAQAAAVASGEPNARGNWNPPVDYTSPKVGAGPSGEGADFGLTSDPGGGCPVCAITNSEVDLTQFENGDFPDEALEMVQDGAGNTDYLGAGGPARSFRAMVEAAAQDGVTLSLNDAYRPLDEQEALYDRYLSGGTLAARPGTSNHGRGTAVDVSSSDGAHQWLRENAGEFGWVWPESLQNPNNTRGYEPWHWEYKADFDPDPSRWTTPNFQMTSTTAALTGAPFNPGDVDGDGVFDRIEQFLEQRAGLDPAQTLDDPTLISDSIVGDTVLTNGDGIVGIDEGTTRIGDLLQAESDQVVTIGELVGNVGDDAALGDDAVSGIADGIDDIDL